MKQRSSIPCGTRFGRLVVVGDGGRANDDTHRAWLCRCDCGNVKPVLPSSLRGGRTRSCGCLRREVSSVVSLTHGKTHTPEYGAWGRMLGRCRNPNSPDYPDYGARGITVCARWESFENFYADMGPRPSKKHSLDRRDNNGNYEPSNCRWASPRQQAGNKRSNVWIEYGGKRMIIEDWAAETGLPRTTLEQRVKRGWSDELTVTAPHGWRPRYGKVAPTRPRRR